jgi:hypothetical protein
MRLKTLEKLGNLYRHAKSAVGYGNKCEARDYYRKIIRLCRKHKIDRQEFYASFSRRQQHQRNPLADGEAVFMHESKLFRRRRVIWEECLFKTVVKYFGCRAFVNSLNNIKIVVGPAPQRRLCIDTFLHLFESARVEAKNYVTQIKSESAATGTAPDRTQQSLLKRSFYYGFAHGMSSRLTSLSAALQAVMLYESSLQEKSAALVVFAGQLDAPNQSALPLPVPKIKREMLDIHAYYAGMSTGNFVALTDALQLVEQAAHGGIREIETLKAAERRRKSQIEEMRLIKNAGGRGFRRVAGNYRYEIITAQPIETFAGVQQSFRFE